VKTFKLGFGFFLVVLALLSMIGCNASSGGSTPTWNTLIDFNASSYSSGSIAGIGPFSSGSNAVFNNGTITGGNVGDPTTWAGTDTAIDFVTSHFHQQGDGEYRHMKAECTFQLNDAGSAVAVSIVGTSGKLYYTFAKIASNVSLYYGLLGGFTSIGTATTGSLDSTTLYTLSMEINLDSASIAYALTKAGGGAPLASDSQTITDTTADGWGFEVYSNGTTPTDSKNPTISTLRISAYY
jgi:hypothetical protein